MTTDYRPLFILAPPRSFTSLVSATLGQHPALYGLPELNLFMAETLAEFWAGADSDGSRKSTYWPIMRHGLLRTVAQLYAGEQSIDSIALAYRWIKTRFQHSTGEVYRELAAKIAPLTIVEKSPAYLRHERYLHRLYQTFPQARFLHLTRHPRGQCESVLKARGGKMMLMMLNAIDYSGTEPVLDPQVLWYEAHRRIQTFLEEIPADQQMQVRGEDFILDPTATLARLCDWLGIAYDAAAQQAMRHPEHSPYASVGPLTARLGNDINFLLDPRIRPAQVKRYDLQEPLAWRPDGLSFRADVLALAEELGYH